MGISIALKIISTITTCIKDWGFYKIPFLILIAIISPSLGFAQPITGQSGAQSAELQIASLEQSYDSQIIQIISNHFDRKKFFVDVNIDAELVNETFATTENQVLSRRPQNVMMPGLPFLPEENLANNPQASQTPETVVNQNTYRSIQLNSIIVNIYADTSFNAEEIDFMARVAGFAAKINEARGDQINITQLAIPDPDFKPVPIQTTEPLQSSSSNNTSSTNSPTGFITQIDGFLPAVIVFGIFVIGIIGYSLVQKNKNQESLRQQRSSLRGDLNFGGAITTQAEAAKQNGVSHARDEDFSAIEFEKLSNNFFTKSEETARLLEYWIDKDPKNGLKNAAEVISTVDTSLLRSIKNELPEKKYLQLQEAVDTLPAMTIEQKYSAAKYFNSLLEESYSGSTKSKKHPNLGLFKFLDHVSDRQLSELIKNETNQTAALIIDYLPEEKAAELLEKLDGQRAAEIMLKISTVHKLSYKQHSVISTRLFDKVIAIRDQEKAEKMGLDNILPILEKLPVAEQKRYIEQIKKSGSALGEILEQEFLTVDQIPDLDEEIIEEGTKLITTSTLLEALIGFDDKVIDKILSVRPKREQKLIKMELDEIDDEKGSEQAKSYLLTSLRKAYALHTQD